MAAEYRVRRLLATEWAEWRTIRLEALRTDPLAFGSTLERELAYADDHWRDRARRGAGPGPESAFVAVAPDGEWAGMGGTFVSEGTMHVYGMWVAPSHRGKGVGRALLSRIIEHRTVELPRAPFELSVNPDQVAARHLYVALGFRPTGEFEPLGHHAPAAVETLRWAGGL